MAKRIALVSCVKTKRTSAAAAGDLYISDLFRSMRKYAEKNADEWFILSAQHGLLRPGRVIAPYERTLITMGKVDRLAWAAKVQKQLLKVLPPRAKVILLAGERYREYIEPFLTAQGFEVMVPMKKMKFGTQLRWLKEQTR